MVHLCGGAAGLAGTTILGARTGRWTNPEDRSGGVWEVVFVGVKGWLTKLGGGLKQTWGKIPILTNIFQMG